MSDINKDIARSYNVLLEKEGIALRGMFIIDPNGILRQITINDLPIGRSVDEALRIIEALRFVEEHGEGKQFFWLFYTHITFPAFWISKMFPYPFFFCSLPS